MASNEHFGNRARMMLGLLVVAVSVVVAVTLAGLGLAKSSLSGGQSAAQDQYANKGLAASVVASTRGPLAIGGVVWDFIYVSNANSLTSANDGQFRARDTLHNAFVVSSVEEHVFVDGVDMFDSTFTPPPNQFPRSWAGHWPETLHCPDNFTDPCNVIGSPAVVPGEQAAVLYAGWGHGAGEPNGRYVFKYTVHGTLNGTPVDVTANSVPIFMTD